jgi:hypothetical protein
LALQFPGSFFAIPRRLREAAAQRYSSAIRSPLGTAQLRKRQSLDPHGVGASPSSIFRRVCCRSAQKRISGHFPFDQFQFGLPLDWNAIILSRKVGIGPVGARPFVKRESPP